MDSVNNKKNQEKLVGVTLDLFGLCDLPLYRMHVLWKDGKVCEFFFPTRKKDDTQLKLSSERIRKAFHEAFPNRDFDEDVESWSVRIETDPEKKSTRSIPSKARPDGNETVLPGMEESTSNEHDSQSPTITLKTRISPREEMREMLSSNRNAKLALVGQIVKSTGASSETARQILNLVDEEGG